MSSYARLALALGISIVVMWLLSQSMVNDFSHFQPTLANLYITLLMASSMGVIMMLVMWRMFERRALNFALLAGFVAVFAGALVLGRSATFIGDEQFLHSMIPHHSRAILLCENASITEPEIVQLCEQIIEAQREEIAIMEDLLRRR